MKKRRGLAYRGSSRTTRHQSIPNLERVEDRLLMAIFVVSSTNDALNAVSGDGTLRGEIIASNATTTQNEIDFMLPNGVQTIALKGPLPPITDTLLINGSTAMGFNQSPLIQITGLNPQFTATGPAFSVNAQGSELRDLIINDFTGDGVDLNAGNSMVDGCWIGLDSSGTKAVPNSVDGILVASAGNSIGGTAFLNPNVISASGANNIEINGTNAGGNVISGNLIGTNAAGTAAVFSPNGPGDGISVSTPNNTIGGSASGFGGIGSGNVISGNQEGLVLFTQANANVVTGNFLGTDITGNVALPNVDFGLYISGGARNTIGGGVGGLNVISGNGNDGVRVQGSGSTGNLIQGNHIGVGFNAATAVGNGHWGVNITTASSNQVGGTTLQGNAPNFGNIIEDNDTKGGAGGVTIVQGIGNGILSNTIYQNGTGPGIALVNGGNNGIAAPIITSVQSGAGQTRIVGTFSGIANTNYRIQFFYSVVANVSGIGDGQNYVLGDLDITTDNTGVAAINTTITPQVPVGSFLTATATQGVQVLNNTSDFSTAIQVAQAVVSDLQVTTTTPAIGPQLDQPYTYMLTVTNAGPNDSPDAVLTDTLPPNSAVISVSGGTVTAGVLTDDLGPLASGALVVVTVDLKPTRTGAFVQTATVTGPDLDPNLSNNTTTFVPALTVVPDSDLSVILTPSATTAPVGSPLTYTLTISNSGPSTANGTVVTVQLPADFTNVVVSPDQGSYTIQPGNLITINTGILPASTSSIVTVSGTPNLVESAVTTASVTSPVADPNPQNNQTSATVDVGNAADLGISIVASPIPAVLNQALVYTIVVTNNGPSSASAPIVIDSLPPGVTYDAIDSSTGGNGVISETGGVVTASLNMLAAGASDTITIVVVPTVSGPITNAVSVSNIPEIDPDQSNNSAAVTVAVSPADVSVTVINPHDPLFIGQQAVYELQVYNAGPSTATNVTLTDFFTGGATIDMVSGGQFLGNQFGAVLGSMAPGQTDTVYIIVDPLLSGTLTDQAFVTSDQFDPDMTNNSSSSSNVVSPTDLSISVAGSTTPVLFGTGLIYVVTITNAGPAVATNVGFGDILPPNEFLLGVVASQGVVMHDAFYTNLFGNLGSLAPGASATVTIAIAPQTTGTFTNAAGVLSDDLDTNPSNNAGSFSIPVVNLPGTIEFNSTLQYANDTDGVVALLVDRIGGTQGTVSATYTTSDFTAVNGFNYLGGSGTVTFGPGQSYAAIFLSVLDDHLIDGNHGFFVSLSNATGGASIGQPAVTGVEINNTNRDLVPPTITGLLAIPNGNAIDGFVLYFDKALDPTRASLLSNYYVFLSGSGAVNQGTPVALAAAEYNAINNTVTLVPTAPLPSNRFYEVLANGSTGTALTDTSGNYLYGSTGPNTNYVAYYGQGTQLTYDDSENNVVTLNMSGGGLMGIYRGANGDAELVNLYGVVPHSTRLSGSVKALNKFGSGHTYIGQINGFGRFGDVRSSLTTPQFYVGSAPVSAASVGVGVPVSLSVSADSVKTITTSVTHKKVTPKGPHHSKR